MTNVIGIDIGGANIKVSDGESGHSVSFPLWKSPEKLSALLTDIFQKYPNANTIALTMTGELADCFTTKNEGVHCILDAVQKAAAKREIIVWQTGGEFFSIEEAFEFPMLVAAANWHALATWAGRVAPNGNSLLIDLGSTTTDLIPMRNGFPVPNGLTDLERLQSSELLYLGAKRTPLCALVQHVQIDDICYPLANEFFATTYDLGILTGHLAEDENCRETANGKSATIANAQCRLARQFCTDTDELSTEFLNQAARVLLQVQVEHIEQGIRRVSAALVEETHSSEIQTILCTGEGEYLTHLALAKVFSNSPQPTTLSLSNIGNPQLSTAACAYAVSVLATERHLPDRTFEFGLGSSFSPREDN